MEGAAAKRAIVGTGFGCNSNCIFCLQETREPAFFPKEEVMRDIIQQRREGANWLVFVGGESTIHPNFLEFVALGKKVGYKRIQVISNGRMFSSKSFVRKLKLAGLTEATISFHGSNAKLHDGLTRVQGSFKQAVEGVKNCKNENILLSFNTAINSLNVNDLPNILEFIHQDLGIQKFDYDALGTAPTGGAFKLKLFPSDELLKKSLKKVCEYGEKHHFVIWITRTHLHNFPKGYEYHKEPWESLVHDTIGIWNRVWYEKPKCESIKCEFCEAFPLCSYIKELKKRMTKHSLDFVKGKNFFEKSDELSKNYEIITVGDIKIAKKHKLNPICNLKFDGFGESWESVEKKYKEFKEKNIDIELEFQINKKSKEFIKKTKGMNVIFSPTNPYNFVKYTFNDSNRLIDTSNSLLPLEEVLSISKGPFKNVPLCIKNGRYREYVVDLNHFDENGIPIPEKLLWSLVRDIRVFPKECENCKLRKDCPGFFGDYVKLFGFDKVFPKH